MYPNMQTKSLNKRRVKIKAKRTLLTFAYLKAAAAHSLSHAEADREGRYYSLMTAMLCCAFSLEAFLNHIGAEKVDFWDDVERKTSPDEKLRIICSVIGFNPNSPPFQTFKAIFRFRNALVHGKTKKLDNEKELAFMEGEKPEEPKTWWEEILTLDMARKWLNDTREIIRILLSRRVFLRMTMSRTGHLVLRNGISSRSANRKIDQRYVTMPLP